MRTYKGGVLGLSLIRRGERHSTRDRGLNDAERLVLGRLFSAEVKEGNLSAIQSTTL